jgi:hypothetical protein
MSTAVATEPGSATGTFVPRILVFSTNNISDPGIDLAGSSHMHYSPGVRVIGLPCTSGIRPSWVVRALEAGFDGVFIASDGDECAYLRLPKRGRRRSRAPRRDARAGPRPPRLGWRHLLGLLRRSPKHVQGSRQRPHALGPAVAR